MRSTAIAAVAIILVTGGVVAQVIAPTTPPVGTIDFQAVQGADENDSPGTAEINGQLTGV